MINYIIRRILIAVPVLFGVTVISFLIVNMAPGSPVDMIVDPNISAEDIAARKAALGLNAPLYVQYWHWLANILQGNLGYSLITFRPVTEIIGERVGPTVLLMGSSLAAGLLVALPLGILSATRQYSRLDYVCTAGSLFGISVPTFFLGLSMIYIFSLLLKWLPSGGMVTLGTGGDLFDRMAHLIMPMTVLGAFFAGKMIRYVRSCMLEILDQDYLRTARAKGLSESVVINRHALRNGLIPIVTVVGLEVASLLGGAVITEQIFSWPGLGQLTMESVLSRDYSTLMGLNLLAAVVVLAINLLTDIVYSIVDPRIRYE